MPIRYRTLDDPGIVVITFSGQVTLADFQNYFRESLEDPRVRPDLDRLADTREVIGFPGSDEVREIGRALRVRPIDAPVRFAVIATSDLGSGVAMMMAGYARFGDRVQIFSDEASALLWLTGPGR